MVRPGRNVFGLTSTSASVAAVAWMVLPWARNLGSMPEEQDSWFGLSGPDTDAPCQLYPHSASILGTTVWRDFVTILTVIAFALGAFVCMYIDVLDMSKDEEGTMTCPVGGSDANTTLVAASSRDELNDSEVVQVASDALMPLTCLPYDGRYVGFGIRFTMLFLPFVVWLEMRCNAYDATLRCLYDSFIKSLDQGAMPDYMMVLLLVALAIGAVACMYVDVLEMSEDREEPLTIRIMNSESMRHGAGLEHQDNKSDVADGSTEIQPAFHVECFTSRSLLCAFSVVLGALMVMLFFWWTGGRTSLDFRIELVELSAHVLAGSHQYIISSVQKAASPDSVTILAMIIVAIGALTCMYVDFLDTSEEQAKPLTNETVDSKTDNSSPGCEHFEDETDAQGDSTVSQFVLNVNPAVRVSLRYVLFAMFGTILVLTLASSAMGSRMIDNMNLLAATSPWIVESATSELELSALAARGLHVSRSIVPNTIVQICLLFCIACTFVTTCVDAKDAIREEVQKLQTFQLEARLQEDKKHL